MSTPASTATGAVWFVVPEGIDDPGRPSGGNLYDARVRDGLVALGWDVAELGCPGDWPTPQSADLTRLRDLLATVPGGGLLLVDGLVGSAATDVLLTECTRLRVVPLVHMPLDTISEGELLRSCAAVLTTSQWCRQWLVDRYRLDDDRVHAVEPGVDRADPAPGTDSGGELLTVAAVTPGKGHDVLVAGLAGVRELDWRLTVVGSLDRDPGFVETLRRQVADLGLAERVLFTGTASRKQVDRAYAEADLFLLASRAETYGIVVAEALAHGLPVVATAVGGVPEALGHAEDGSVPGELVPPDDPQALATVVRGWLTIPARRLRLCRAARARRLTLPGWDRTACRLSAVLGGVLASVTLEVVR